jgi:hypothetical protein
MRTKSALFLFLLLSLSCGLFHQDDTITDKGTVKYINLEGGFWGIVGDHGQNYDPINLPKDCEREGLRVFFRAKFTSGPENYRMWGKNVELLSITKLE